VSSVNDITGDSIQTKIISDQYRNNFDNIFRKTKESIVESTYQQPKEENETQIHSS
jgi:hypothetical protein